MKNDAGTFSKRKLEKFRKQLGENLTYSVYRQLREWEVGQDDIAKMYGISKSTLQLFVKAHKEVLLRESS